ncbi:MAG: hypothetical protein AAF747_03960, partial [Planctomycetota bacterium]
TEPLGDEHNFEQRMRELVAVVQSLPEETSDEDFAGLRDLCRRIVRHEATRTYASSLATGDRTRAEAIAAWYRQNEPEGWEFAERALRFAAATTE